MHAVALCRQRWLGRLFHYFPVALNQLTRNQCTQNYGPVGSSCALNSQYTQFEKRTFISATSVPDLEVYPDGSGAFKNHSIPKVVVDRILDYNAAELAAGPASNKFKRQSCATPNANIICQWYTDYCLVEQIEMTDYDCANWACAYLDGWVS